MSSLQPETDTVLVCHCGAQHSMNVDRPANCTQCRAPFNLADANAGHGKESSPTGENPTEGNKHDAFNETPRPLVGPNEAPKEPRMDEPMDQSSEHGEESKTWEHLSSTQFEPMVQSLDLVSISTMDDSILQIPEPDSPSLNSDTRKARSIQQMSTSPLLTNYPSQRMPPITPTGIYNLGDHEPPIQPMNQPMSQPMSQAMSQPMSQPAQYTDVHSQARRYGASPAIASPAQSNVQHAFNSQQPMPYYHNQFGSPNTYTPYNSMMSGNPAMMDSTPMINTGMPGVPFLPQSQHSTQGVRPQSPNMQSPEMTHQQTIPAVNSYQNAGLAVNPMMNSSWMMMDPSMVLLQENIRRLEHLNQTRGLSDVEKQEYQISLDKYKFTQDCMARMQLAMTASFQMQSSFYASGLNSMNQSFSPDQAWNQSGHVMNSPNPMSPPSAHPPESGEPHSHELPGRSSTDSTNPNVAAHQPADRDLSRPHSNQTGPSSTRIVSSDDQCNSNIPYSHGKPTNDKTATQIQPPVGTQSEKDFTQDSISCQTSPPPELTSYQRHVNDGSDKEIEIILKDAQKESDDSSSSSEYNTAQNSPVETPVNIPEKGEVTEQCDNSADRMEQKSADEREVAAKSGSSMISDDTKRQSSNSSFILKCSEIQSEVIEKGQFNNSVDEMDQRLADEREVARDSGSNKISEKNEHQSSNSGSVPGESGIRSETRCEDSTHDGVSVERSNTTESDEHSSNCQLYYRTEAQLTVTNTADQISETAQQHFQTETGREDSAHDEVSANSSSTTGTNEPSSNSQPYYRTEAQLPVKNTAEQVTETVKQHPQTGQTCKETTFGTADESLQENLAERPLKPGSTKHGDQGGQKRLIQKAMGGITKEREKSGIPNVHSSDVHTAAGKEIGKHMFDAGGSLSDGHELGTMPSGNPAIQSPQSIHSAVAVGESVEAQGEAVDVNSESVKTIEADPAIINRNDDQPRTMADAEELHEKLFEVTKVVIESVCGLSDDKRNTNKFTKDERSMIKDAKRKLAGHLTEHKRLTIQLEDAQTDPTVKPDKNKCKTWMTELRGVHLNVFMDYFDKMMKLLLKANSELYNQYSIYIPYYEILIKTKKPARAQQRRGATTRLMTQSEPEKRKRTQFRVYIAENFGEVESVEICFSSPCAKTYPLRPLPPENRRIWFADIELQPLQSHQRYTYKYYVKDTGSKDGAFEYIDTAISSVRVQGSAGAKIQDRMLTMEESCMPIIYEGAALPNLKGKDKGIMSVWYGFRRTFTYEEWRERETGEGFCSMLPEWSEDTFLSKTTAEMCTIVSAVYDRLHRIHRDSPYFTKAMDDILKTMVWWHETYIRQPEPQWNVMLCSLLTHLWLWSKMPKSISIDTIRQLLTTTHQCLITVPGFDCLSMDEISDQLGDIPKEGFNAIIKNLTRREGVSDGDFPVVLIPYIHAVNLSQLKIASNRGWRETLWWGEVDVIHEYKTMMQRVSTFKCSEWYKLLLPFFSVDKWAARILLAVLSSEAIVKLLNDMKNPLEIPVDALMACIAHHGGSLKPENDKFWNHLEISIICEVGQMQGEDISKVNGVKVLGSALESTGELIQKYIPRKMIYEKVILIAIRLYLILINEVAKCQTLDEEEVKLLNNRIMFITHISQAFTTDGYLQRLNTNKIQIWERMYKCSEGLEHIEKTWTDNMNNIVSEHLNKLNKTNSQYPLHGNSYNYGRSIVDCYFKSEGTNKVILSLLLKYSIENASILLTEQFRMDEGDRDKIAYIIDHAVTQSWSTLDADNSDSIHTVCHILEWKNFSTLQQFIVTHSDRVGKLTRERMDSGIVALRDVITQLMVQEITIGQYNLLKDQVNDLVEACNCEDEELRRAKDKIPGYVQIVQSLISKFNEFRDMIKQFLITCRKAFTGKRTHPEEKLVYDWVEDTQRHKPINQLYDKQREVLCEELSPEFRHAACDYQQKKRYLMLEYFFREELKRLDDDTRLTDLANAYNRACDRHSERLNQLKDGSITASTLRRMKKEIYDGEFEGMKNEFEQSDIPAERIKQIDVCDKADTYRHAAETIRKLKDDLSLQANFEPLDVFTLPERDMCLQQINEHILKDAELLETDISEEKVNCLENVGKYTKFVEWARDEVPESEIRTFVDLAHNNIGENDDMTTKILALMDALSGYSSIIYEMDPATTDFPKFMQILQKVWGALQKNAQLPMQLDIAAQELEVWEDLKKNLDSFEIDTLSQAQSINDTGVFDIGAIPMIDGDSCDRELNDVIQLNCELKRRKVHRNADNKPLPAKFTAVHVEPHSSSKFKEFKGSLEELQEKLTLIAGEKQKEHKDTIKKFDELRDIATKLGKAFLELQRAGCILFDDMQIIMKCNSDSNIPLEFKFAGNDTPIVAQRTPGKTVINHANDLHKFLVDCIEEWERTLFEARKKNRVLNLYTTEQLVTLRRQLALMFRTVTGQSSSENLDECLRLIRIVAPANRQKLFKLGQAYKKQHEMIDEEADSGSEQVVEDQELKDLVEEIMLRSDLVEQEQCVYAINVLGTKKEFDDYVDFIENMDNLESTQETISSQVRRGLKTGDANMMTQLEAAWKKFLEMTSSTHPKLLSIDQLVFTLNKIQETSEQRVTQRTLPSWLEKGRPNLLVCDKDNMLQTVLSVYMADRSADSPTRSEVLICTKQTTIEEVKIFMLRAVSDCKSVYCMVNCERLDNAACREIEEQIYQSKEYREDGYTICFFCDEGVRDTRIRSCLSKFQLKNSDILKEGHISQCKNYITEILSGSVDGSARTVEQEHLACRVVRSERAGVGKSLHCQRVRQRMPSANYVIIPIYRQVDVDQIITQMYSRCTATGPNIIHIDISYEVEEGVDDMLMSLIILRSICSSRGLVWHLNPEDYYLIECMPFKMKGKCAHHLINFMPTVRCYPPVNHQTNVIIKESLDSQILVSESWQIVLRFLRRHEARDHTYTLEKGLITDKGAALKLLIRYCGLKSPSWSELTNFVKFLSSQLQKVELSPYCTADQTTNPAGFKKFVVEFMIIMAQDFATRSLIISEESPGKTINEAEEETGGNVLNLLSCKRSWESSNHPYLFFNEDSTSFSFIGFVLSNEITSRECSILDPETGECLDRYPKFPTRLKQELEQTYQQNLSSPFNQLTKEQKLDKMQQIMVEHPHLYRRAGDQITDPDTNYELTLDNVKKILAIHQRIRVGIPVIVMGDTGCGKTKLIDYASKLQVPEELRQAAEGIDNDESKVINMITVKVHGGTTENDIIRSVRKAQATAKENQSKCEQYARKRGWVNDDGSLFNVPSVYTVLFLDEANTTEAIGLIKEILCDRRYLGEALELESGLKIIAACNPYRKHNNDMIKKLREAGLGYFVDERETTDKFAGHIPMRHLVYRVQALSQSLIPLVWDFGSLKNDIERQYITQMISRASNSDLEFGNKTHCIAELLAITHRFMKEQKDECSFVSLRDVNRLLEITRWFRQISPALIRLMTDYHEDGVEQISDSGSDIDNQELDPEHTLYSEPAHEVVNCLLLAIGVCYLARLEEATRQMYADEIGQVVLQLLSTDTNQLELLSGAEYFNRLINRCQDVIINEVLREVRHGRSGADRSKAKHTNIAKNKALKENVFMMIVCIENRIPLFLVGKPGSSKSLSKAMVFDAMVGRNARSKLIQQFKQTNMISFQCSRLATPNSIVSVFQDGAKRQENRALDEFVSIVVLDEVGLAEDSKNMPLKALHPLLEDGCEGHETPQPWKRVAFIGISNWALDPAKMNRGIFVQRGTPEKAELNEIARGICEGAHERVWDQVEQVIEPLVKGYLAICETQKSAERDLTEFFGLRDFYSLVKMILKFAEHTKYIYRSQIIHSIKRNFGGFDPVSVDCLEQFEHHFKKLKQWDEIEDPPPTHPMDLVKCSITNDVAALESLESRYLLILTENLSILGLILEKFAKSSKQPEIIFGSYFKRDIHFTQVCHNINLIKNCMASGTPVILLNLDDLYESLYDTLNQYFSTLGDTRFVDLGLGTHRVKAFIHKDFRLVVVADSKKVYKEFPIPLINRLEKHYISMETLLDATQKAVKEDVELWAELFVLPDRLYSNQCELKCSCGREMREPYKLPCPHHVGSCCQERILRNTLPRECQTENCGEPIPEDWKWQIDINAKANRDYFECSSPQKEFIGYTKEMVALIILQSSRTAGGDHSENIRERILKLSKKQILQVATAESVLRIGKTKLKVEQEWINTVYFREQKHDNLYTYLHQAFTEEQDYPRPHNEHVQNGNFTQVTTFARLLASKEMDLIKENFNAENYPLSSDCCTINDFDTEAEFTDKVRNFYTNCRKHVRNLLVLQCDSAHLRPELLDSVRYIILRESKNIQPCQAIILTVLILNIPRGVPLLCYQGQPWKCIHIDDPSSSNLKTPPLRQCLELKPSKIITYVIREAKSQYQTAEVMADSEIADNELEDCAGQVSVETVILPALPIIISAIEDHDERSSVFLRKILHSSDIIARKVVVVWLEYGQFLLEESEERNKMYNWVTSNAARAVVMKRNETIRSALESSLHEEMGPAFAVVLAQCEPYNNLRLLNDEDSVTRKQFWLELMKACFTVKLHYKDVATADEKLPETIKVSGQTGGTRWNCEFPFSWIVFGVINDILDDDKTDQPEQLFMKTPIGEVIEEYFEIETRSEGSFRDRYFELYLKDFVFLVHPCQSLQGAETVEHKLICTALDKLVRLHDFRTLVRLHEIFKMYREHFDKLSVIIAVILKWDREDEKGNLLKTVWEKLSEQPDDFKKYPCHVLVLMTSIEVAQNISTRQQENNFTGFVTLISSLDGLFQDYVLRVLNNGTEGFILDIDKNRFSERAKVTLNARHRLIVKRNYIQHVLLRLNPAVTDRRQGNMDQYSFICRASKDIISDFKNYENFCTVVMILEKSLVKPTTEVFGCDKECKKCKKPMASPVRIPCTHFICISCSTDTPLMCPYCKKNVTGRVVYDPKQDPELQSTEKMKRIESLKTHRRLLNEFFMAFLSDIVFHHELIADQTETSSQIIEWLVNCITAQNGTRPFNMFNAQDVIDPKPVVRSFLLKLLLNVALRDWNGEEVEENGVVATQRLMEFINEPKYRVYKNLRSETIALLINCVKDYLRDNRKGLTYYSQHAGEDYVIEHWCQVTDKLNLNYLIHTAKTHILLENNVSHILSSETVNDPLIADIKEFLEIFDEITEQPKMFICRLIMDRYGEGKILDIKQNEEVSFLLPETIHRALTQFSVDDHLAVGASNLYKDVIGMIENTLTCQDDQLNDSLQQLNQVTDVSCLFHAMFTRVTKFFTTDHPPKPDRTNHLQQSLQDKFNNQSDMVWLESLLNNRMFNNSLRLETAEGVMISMLALRMYTSARSGQSLAAPFSTIVHHVSTCQKKFLPTMPDSLVAELHDEVAKMFKNTHYGDAKMFACPNGHPYYIGECKQAMEEIKCPECDAMIGGGSHRLRDDNRQATADQYKTEPGYNYNTAVQSPVAERLPVLSNTVMRCLLHVALLAATTTHSQEVKRLVQQEDCEIYLIQRIKCDVEHVSKTLNTNQEKVMIMLHLTMNTMEDCTGGSYNMDSKDSRQIWEKAFDTRIIKPVFNQTGVQLAGESQRQISQNHANLETLTQQTPALNEANLLDSSYMWIYSRPLNLELLQTVTVQQDSVLKKFIDRGRELKLVTALPQIIKLVRKLALQFDCKFKQEDTEKTSIMEFIEENGDNRELVDAYIQVWNDYVKILNESATGTDKQLTMITHQSALITIMPISVSPDNRRGSTYRRIIRHLVETHNQFLNLHQNDNNQTNSEQGIDVALVSRSNLVCLADGGQELIPIVIRHSQYEFGESFDKSCEWDKVDEDISYQYLTGRRRINPDSIYKLPVYHFPNEFTIITLIKKLSDQELLEREDKEKIMSRLANYGVNQLNSVLTQLETMIRICSTIREYSSAEKLSEAISRNFGEGPDWQLDSIEVRHIVSLWSAVKFLQAKAFIRNQQVAFDEIVPECKRDLDEEVKTEIREQKTSYGSYMTQLLLEHLFEFILFKLNNVTASHTVINQDMEFFNQSLSDSLDAFIVDKYEGRDEGNQYERLKMNYSDKQIPISQATACWEYIYTIYTTPVANTED